MSAFPAGPAELIDRNLVGWDGPVVHQLQRRKHRAARLNNRSRAFDRSASLNFGYARHRGGDLVIDESSQDRRRGCADLDNSPSASSGSTRGTQFSRP
jgi:hypothetical protein